MDVFGEALKDYFYSFSGDLLLLHNSYGEAEEMPTDIFFRSEADLPGLEKYALNLCKGRILDVGAGAGSHALILQHQGQDVTALEISALASEVIRQRGVDKVVTGDILDYQGEKFDTVLLMMNGIGLVETLDGLKKFLRHARQLIHPSGQLIFDSSDISYLYEHEPRRQDKPYFGEIRYQYEYKGIKGNWFGWLYVDQETLFEIAAHEGWLTQIVYENDDDQYLARLIMTDTPR